MSRIKSVAFDTECRGDPVRRESWKGDPLHNRPQYAQVRSGTVWPACLEPQWDLAQARRVPKQ